MKKYSIENIENLTEAEAIEMAEETAIIKGHNVYFVDFDGWFGYSALVFSDGLHIYHANDYALHHKGKTREELHGLYVRSLRKKLFSDSEFDKVKNYEDKIAKEYYLRNYYRMRRDHISMFFCGSEKEREEIKKKTEKMIFSPIFFAYYDEKDAEFVKNGVKMLNTLRNAERENNTVEYWKSAFLYEMFNHEYGINWQGDYDVCSCFGNCSGVKDYESTEELFSACNFSDIQRNAYAIARREYIRKSNESYL